MVELLWIKELQMIILKTLQVKKNIFINSISERYLSNANEEKTVSSHFLHCMWYLKISWRVLWTLLLISYPLFRSSGDLSLNTGPTILSNKYCPFNVHVFLIIQKCQHITYMIGIIWKVLFRTAVQESVAEEIFNSPGLSAVGAVFQRPSPLCL